MDNDIKNPNHQFLMKILLQPCSGKEAMDHFEDTINNSVSMGLLQSYLEPEEISKLQELGTGQVNVWGFTPKKGESTRKEWRALEKNDLVLFYANKRFFHVAKVHSKVHNPELAKKLWGDDSKGYTWEYIYFVKDARGIELPYNPTILRKKDGNPYAENHVVQGATILDETNSEVMYNYIKEKEGEIVDEDHIEPSHEETKEFLREIKEPRTPSEAQQEIERVSEQLNDKPTDEKIRKTKVLMRNPKFARLTKQQANYVCEICGQRPFLKKDGEPYAEAHHKYELAKNRIDDPKYMICVCPTCHKVIHFGSNKALEERKNMNYS